MTKWILGKLVVGIAHRSDHTHDGKGYNAIGKEVVIQGWQISSASRKELNCSVNLRRKGVAALYHAEELLLVLLEVVDLARKVLEDLVGAIDGDECCNIVEGRVAGQRARVGRSEKLLVGIFKGHG